MAPSQVLAFGLDTLDATVVERLISEGRMPHLAALRERGLEARVEAPPAALLNSWMVWPSFITGQSVGTHGWHSHKPWNPGGQHLHHPDPERLPIQPFWGDAPAGCRLALLDVPHAPDPGSGFPGVFVSGWHGPDDFGRAVRPPRLRGRLVRTHGKPITGPEIFGPQTPATLDHQRREALDGLEQFTALALDVLGREAWDLFLAVLAGAHRANHYLWPPPGHAPSGQDGGQLRLLATARDALYEATDRALGRLLAAAPPNARVLVFALHGMGANTGWGELFGRIASHLKAGGGEEEPPAGLAYRLKQTLPTDWVGAVTRRLPPTLMHRLIPVWSRRMHDWASTPWFALPSDLHGNVRVNLRGREAQGVVEPGAEYEALLDRLTHEFMELEDLRDGARVVVEVDRMDHLVGPDAPRRAVLPDLVVRFTDRSALGCPGLRSRHGELRLDAAASFPSGRTGNHTSTGWCVAAGPGIEPGRLQAPVHAVDLTATLLTWMGAPLPDRMEGEPVPRLTARGRA